jgi:hypothetical protein
VLVLEFPDGGKKATKVKAGKTRGFEAKLVAGETYTYWVTSDGVPTGFEGTITVEG